MIILCRFSPIRAHIECQIFKKMFFSQVSDVGVNTALKPERAETYQLGFNTYKKAVFTEEDVSRFKTSGIS